MHTPRNPSPEELPGADSTPPPVPSPRADATPADPRIEDYLDHIVAPLVGVVPYARRQALRAEWRLHLDMRIAAYTELGSEPKEAVAQALKQFGNPRDLAQHWLKSWQQRRPQTTWVSVAPPMATAFVWFGMGTLLALAGISADHLVGFSALTALSTPLWAGLLTGLLSRGRHAMGTFYALAGLIALTGWRALRADPMGDCFTELSILQFVLWMPLGCASAALGGWLQSLRERLHPPLAWE